MPHPTCNKYDRTKLDVVVPEQAGHGVLRVEWCGTKNGNMGSISEERAEPGYAYGCVVPSNCTVTVMFSPEGEPNRHQYLYEFESDAEEIVVQVTSTVSEISF